MTSPFNPRLFAALNKHFGQVSVVRAGEPADVRYRTEWHQGKPRIQIEVDGGESYFVNCPFCGDQRGRLGIRYLWATKDLRTQRPLLFLANCFNEGCISDRTRQDQLRIKVFGFSYIPFVLEPAVGRSAAVPARTPKLQQITLPENSVALTDPACRRAPLAYLEQRRFDPRELSALWGVRFSRSSSAPAPAFKNRLVVPIFAPATNLAKAGLQTPPTLVGWQARTIMPRPPKGCPKYFTARDLEKSAVLYGLPQALQTTGPVAIVEGVTDVWRLATNAVALFGKSLSHRQQELVLRHFRGRPLVLFLDRDAAAEANTIRSRLLAARKAVRDPGKIVIAQHPEDCDDVGDCSRRQAWQQVAAAVGGVFDELWAMVQESICQRTNLESRSNS